MGLHEKIDEYLISKNYEIAYVEWGYYRSLFTEDEIKEAAELGRKTLGITKHYTDVLDIYEVLKGYNSEEDDISAHFSRRIKEEDIVEVVLHNFNETVSFRAKREFHDNYFAREYIDRYMVQKIDQVLLSEKEEEEIESHKKFLEERGYNVSKVEE